MEEEHSMGCADMQEKRYLLSIEEFLAGESGRRLMEEAFFKVDSERRSRAERMRTDRAKASCLGAGLLLQLAVQDAAGSGCGILSAQESVRDCGGEQQSMREAAGSSGRERQAMQESAVSSGRKRQSMQESAGNCGGEQQSMREAAGSSGGEQQMRKKAVSSIGSQNQAQQCMKCELTRYTVSQAVEMISSPLSLFYHYGKNGKPYFREYPFFFNISHSGDFVFCALSLREIGADIQQHQKCGRERIANRFFSKEETAMLKGRQEDEALFFRLWARKEAYGKLTGEGIAGTVGVNLLPEALSENKRLIWEEYEEVRGYSLAVCQYLPEMEDWKKCAFVQ